MGERNIISLERESVRNEIVENLIKLGVNDEVISVGTKLTTEQLAELREQLEND